MVGGKCLPSDLQGKICYCSKSGVTNRYYKIRITLGNISIIWELLIFVSANIFAFFITIKEILKFERRKDQGRSFNLTLTACHRSSFSEAHFSVNSKVTLYFSWRHLFSRVSTSPQNIKGEIYE